MEKGREVRHQRDAILAFLVEGNFALNPHVTRSKPDSFRDTFNDHSINAGKKTAQQSSKQRVNTVAQVSKLHCEDLY